MISRACARDGAGKRKVALSTVLLVVRGWREPRLRRAHENGMPVGKTRGGNLRSRGSSERRPYRAKMSPTSDCENQQRARHVSFGSCMKEMAAAASMSRPGSRCLPHAAVGLWAQGEGRGMSTALVFSVARLPMKTRQFGGCCPCVRGVSKGAGMARGGSLKSRHDMDLPSAPPCTGPQLPSSRGILISTACRDCPPRMIASASLTPSHPVFDFPDRSSAS